MAYPTPWFIRIQTNPRKNKITIDRTPCYEFRRPYIQFFDRPYQVRRILKKLRNSVDIAVNMYDKGKYHYNKTYKNGDLTGRCFTSGEFIICTRLHTDTPPECDMEPLVFMICYYTLWSSQLLPEGFTPSPLPDPTEYLFSTILDILKSLTPNS